MEALFNILGVAEDLLWEWAGFPIIVLMGVVFTFSSRFLQIRKFGASFRTFLSMLTQKTTDERGIHPLNAFFASIGGCIGIGNIVGVCTAVQVGGPGALFWIWITSLLGTMFKYSEVYLGIRYRVKNERGSYDGGPMYYLQRAFKTPYMAYLAAFLFCIYGVEVYQFRIVVDSLTANLGANYWMTAFILLALMVYACAGGIKRVGEISSTIIPFFILIYIAMASWVLFNNISALPDVFKMILTSAFTGSSALGGFVGSSLMMTISQGVRRGCYAIDVGVGYPSIIHSESSTLVPERQASLTIVEIFLDTFLVCTTSVVIILATGIWAEPIHESMLVQTALSQYFPYVHIYMPLFIFLLGYSTLIAYFAAGMKCATFLSPKYGKALYYSFASLFLFTFTFLESSHAILVMSLVQAVLLIINSIGIYRLRKEISYNIEGEETASAPVELREA